MGESGARVDGLFIEAVINREDAKNAKKERENEPREFSEFRGHAR